MNSSRILAAGAIRRSLAHSFSPRATATRQFRTTTSYLVDTVTAAATPLPVRRPVGAFRGGLLGFLSGSVGTGLAVYYYVLEEYKVSNELLTEDIYALQAAVQRVNTYVQGLEERLVEKERKEK